jgi:hypothetical protein
MAGEQLVDFETRWGDLVARAWADSAFKMRLLADPAAVLKEHGMTLPAGITVKVVENTDNLIHLVLPQKPAAVELTEEELRNVAGGHCNSCGGCGGCEASRSLSGCERCRHCRG